MGSTSTAQLDMILQGSGWVNVFGDDAGASTISGNIDNLMATSSSAGSGIKVIADANGVHFPKLVGKKPTAVERNNCVLFIAESFERDFRQFEKLAQSHAGYIVLVVNHEENIDRWEKMVDNPSRLFHLTRPLSPTDAQTFVGSCVKKIVMYENLKAAEMVF